MGRPVNALLVGLSLSCLMTGAAQAQTPATFPVDASGQINFVLPSKNIGCTFTPQGGTTVYQPFDGGPELSCDRIEPQYVRLVLTPKQVRRFDNVGDRGCCDESNVLQYGSRWSHGPFTCDSAQSGLTCKRSDGRGFSVSRASIKVY
jgi:hypothetical protein